jgi:hypothetical protein
MNMLAVLTESLIKQLLIAALRDLFISGTRLALSWLRALNELEALRELRNHIVPIHAREETGMYDSRNYPTSLDAAEAFTPHDWLDERNAVRATLHFHAIFITLDIEH